MAVCAPIYLVGQYISSHFFASVWKRGALWQPHQWGIPSIYSYLYNTHSFVGGLRCSTSFGWADCAENGSCNLHIYTCMNETVGTCRHPNLCNLQGGRGGGVKSSEIRERNPYMCQGRQGQGPMYSPATARRETLKCIVMASFRLSIPEMPVRALSSQQ